MSPLVLDAGAALAGLLLGYAAGRALPGRRIVTWAQNQADRPGLHPQLLLAVPVILVTLALLWTFHPRRTITNRRSWKTEDPT